MTKNDATPATMGLPTERPVAGDFDYDTHGHGYAQLRRTDSRIAALVHEALGAARTVLNVGAGAGSYEPEDRYVLALEPSAAMRAQRPPRLTPAIHGIAEALPLDDQSVDASNRQPSCRPYTALASLEPGSPRGAADGGAVSVDATLQHFCASVGSAAGSPATPQQLNRLRAHRRS